MHLDTFSQPGHQDPIYYVNNFVSGELDSLENASNTFATTYERFKSKNLYGLVP